MRKYIFIFIIMLVMVGVASAADDIKDVKTITTKNITYVNFDKNGTFIDSQTKTLNTTSKEVISTTEKILKGDISIIDEKDVIKDKTEYITKNYNLKGDYVVNTNNHTVNITIHNATNYGGVLKLNITATVDGKSKVIHNPYQIVNPPVSVYTDMENYITKIS